MSQICSQCKIKPCWYDAAAGRYSPYCSNSCRQSVQTVYTVQSTPATQGQPLCRICSSAAFFDGKRFSPGCGRSHAQQAINQGFTTPR